MLVGVLRRVALGYLGLADKDEPYLVPVNFVYIGGVFEGRKMRHLSSDPSHLVAFVAARLVTDEAEKLRALQGLFKNAYSRQ